MPKRKRGDYSSKVLDPELEAELKRESVEKVVVKATRVLNKALRTAKGFERIKLGKRIKISRKEQDVAKCDRLMAELEALKSLDLSVVVESYLRKVLSKSKSISESTLLPPGIKEDLSKKSTALSDSSAISNVAARMYKMKHVKEASAQIMDLFCSALGVPSSTTAQKIAAKVTQSPPHHGENGSEQPMGHSSPVEQVTGNSQVVRVIEDGVELTVEEDDPQLELESQLNDLSRNDKIIGDITEDIQENANEEIRGKQVVLEDHTLEIASNLSVSLSDISRSPSPPWHGKKSSIHERPPMSGSTFLPTLMGGYWSGSESATDDEAAPAPKKNRPGQHARRATWEKKYGAKANHLKDQQPSSRLNDKDWDPKRGAKIRDDRGRKRGGGHILAGRSRFTKVKGFAAGDKAVVAKTRPRGMGKKDDAGPLHPSWEAAKKAKAAKQVVKFQGKKMVFD